MANELFQSQPQPVTEESFRALDRKKQLEEAPLFATQRAINSARVEAERVQKQKETSPLFRGIQVFDTVREKIFGEHPAFTEARAFDQSKSIKDALLSDEAFSSTFSSVFPVGEMESIGPKAARVLEKQLKEGWAKKRYKQ